MITQYEEPGTWTTAGTTGGHTLPPGFDSSTKTPTTVPSQPALEPTVVPVVPISEVFFYSDILQNSTQGMGNIFSRPLLASEGEGGIALDLSNTFSGPLLVAEREGWQPTETPSNPSPTPSKVS